MPLSFFRIKQLHLTHLLSGVRHFCQQASVWFLLLFGFPPGIQRACTLHTRDPASLHPAYKGSSEPAPCISHSHLQRPSRRFFIRWCLLCFGLRLQCQGKLISARGETTALSGSAPRLRIHSAYRVTLS
ncbi:hypothetical protein E2C01_092831 [Portunus trituberculatus]|uniref:Uncharacterized protein n=1 Tax=Portunus trituberculatus TaxID=210409 RepID=A0A5B7JSY2_PORTR|nr:hypothetical protein [Portunus trituberculatus]